MMTEQITKKKSKQFFALLTISSILLFIFHLAKRVNSYNATLLSFSYKYGFISRGLIGSIYQGLNHILPFNMQTYRAVNTFVLITTILFDVFFLWFLAFLWKKIAKTKEESATSTYVQLSGWHPAWNVMTFLLFFVVPTFAGYYNFGRVDMYMVLLSMIAVMILVSDKGLCFLPIIASLGVMIHEGYVFMYFNIILVLLIYKMLSKMNVSEKKAWKPYFVLFVMAFVAGSALFLYFHFFSHGGGEDIYDEIVEIANKMSYHGKCHKDVVKAEILGVDLTEKEVEYHIANLCELPIFLALMSPFIMILFRFFKKVWMYAKEQMLEKIKYFFVIAGALTTLPLFIMKVDYGRWCFAVLFYYCVMILSLMAMKDEIIITSFSETMVEIRENWITGRLLLGYILLITPLCDLSICKFSTFIFNLPEYIQTMLSF